MPTFRNNLPELKDDCPRKLIRQLNILGTLIFLLGMGLIALIFAHAQHIKPH